MKIVRKGNIFKRKNGGLKDTNLKLIKQQHYLDLEQLLQYENNT